MDKGIWERIREKKRERKRNFRLYFVKGVVLEVEGEVVEGVVMEIKVVEFYGRGSKLVIIVKYLEVR